MKRIKPGSILIVLGVLLIAAALVLACFNIHADRRAGDSSAEALDSLSPVIMQRQADKVDEYQSGIREKLPDYVRNPGMEMPVEDIDGIGYIGILNIPVLELELPVIKEWSYPLLNTAPCRYSGSAYSGDFVLLAHSFKSHFGRLNELKPGDEIIFTDSSGNTFFYDVAEVLIMSPYAVEEMKESEYELTLFSCTFDSQNRVTVRCTLRESREGGKEE